MICKLCEIETGKKTCPICGTETVAAPAHGSGEPLPSSTGSANDEDLSRLPKWIRSSAARFDPAVRLVLFANYYRQPNPRQRNSPNTKLTGLFRLQKGNYDRPNIKNSTKNLPIVRSDVAGIFAYMWRRRPGAAAGKGSLR